MTVIAVTGGTGFVGQAVLRRAARTGITLRALTRRDQPDAPGVMWIAGALDRGDSLAQLVDGADAVLHIAGVVSAARREGFRAGNIDGTQAIVDAARAAGVRRFVHVSSLAAREPSLSDYGWSKAGAEEVVTASMLDWTIVRPPAVFGPGDTEMLDLFRMARRGLALLPPGGRMSVIAVDELARLLLTLATDPAAGIGATYEPDDGHPGGWSHASFAQAIARAAGRRKVRTFAVPGWLLRVGAHLDVNIRRAGAKLTHDRARYIAHPDWVANAAAHPPANLWQNEMPTVRALADTLIWYRGQGWLR